MWETWILTSWTDVAMTLASTVVVYAAVVAFTRIFGLRSLSKMAAFDFVMTIAIGSLVATAIATPSPPLLLSLTTLGLLFVGQKSLAIARKRKAVRSLIDNSPLLLMVHGEMLTENLLEANVTEGDLRAKLREANVLDYREIKAVVLEATGDVSVLHGDPEKAIDTNLLQGVRGADEHFPTTARGRSPGRPAA